MAAPKKVSLGSANLEDRCTDRPVEKRKKRKGTVRTRTRRRSNLDGDFLGLGFRGGEKGCMRGWS